MSLNNNSEKKEKKENKETEIERSLVPFLDIEKLFNPLYNLNQNNSSSNFFYNRRFYNPDNTFLGSPRFLNPYNFEDSELKFSSSGGINFDIDVKRVNNIKYDNIKTSTYLTVDKGSIYINQGFEINDYTPGLYVKNGISVDKLFYKNINISSFFDKLIIDTCIEGITSNKKDKSGWEDIVKFIILPYSTGYNF